MHCWFCLDERDGSDEHIFPWAIGGRLVTRRVCAPCNSELGSRVDSGLTEHLSILLRRAELGLGGNSGRVPDGLTTILANAVLASDPTQRVKVNKRADGGLDLRLIYSEKMETTAEGATVKRIRLDKRDAGQIPTIIARARRRNGLAPLSQEELSAAALEATQRVHTHNEPEVIATVDVDLVGYRRALLKIAYEIGCLWMGDDYLDDPEAGRLRSAIWGHLDFDQLADISEAQLGVPEDFKLLSADPAEHVAVVVAAGGEVWATVKVFDICFARVRLTDDASRYPAIEVGRFLRIDARSGLQTDRTPAQELERVTAERMSLLLAGTPMGAPPFSAGI